MEAAPDAAPPATTEEAAAAETAGLNHGEPSA